jgi:hypothetical protein
MKSKLFYITLAVFLSVPLLASAQDSPESDSPAQSTTKAQEDTTPIIAKSAEQKTNQGLKAEGTIEAAGYIKAKKGICIGDKCKENWPVLKCAEYKDRPKNESGNAYCESIGKTCSSVVLTGSGMSQFSECGDIPNAPHKTRCCWVE